MRLIGPRVLVKRLPAETSKSSLIELVEFYQTPSNFAVVLSVGNGRLTPAGIRQPVDGVKEGDTVVIKDYSGSPILTEIRGEGSDTIIVMEDDILAVIEP